MRDTTGRSIEALLVSAQDGNPEVRDAVISALRAMAGKDTVAVLQCCERWLVANKPNSTPDIQRLTIVRAIKAILSSHASYKSLPDSLLTALVNASIVEMTANNDLTSEWAKESSSLCAELCDLSPQSAVPTLVDPIQSTALPHYFVMATLAKFAEDSPLRFLPHLKEVMSKVLPILGLVKQDNHRQVFASALGAFADSVLQLSHRNEELTPRSKSTEKLEISEFADEMYTGINFLVNDWSRISEQRVRGPVLHAIGSMSAILSDENRCTLLKKVVELIAAGLKREKPKDQLAVSTGFAASLCNCTDTVKIAFGGCLDTIMNSLLGNLVPTLAVSSDDPSVLPNCHALLSAAEHLGNYHMDAFLTYLSKTLDAKSGSRDPPVRAACLTIIKHLVSRKSLDSQVDPYKDNIIATVKLAAEDSDWRVKKAIVSCVMAMGATELQFFSAVGGTDLLTFLIRHAALPNGVVQEFEEAAAKKKDLAALGTSPQDVRDTCRNAIALFTASKGSLDDVLWPFLLEHLSIYSTEPSLQFALPTVCRALVQLGRRKETTDTYYVDFKVQVNVPPPEHLAVLLLLHAMCREMYSLQDMLSILSAMEVVCPLIDDPYRFPEMEEPPIATLWLSTIPQLIELLNQGQGEGPSSNEWEDMICRLTTKTMNSRGSEEWAAGMTTAAVNLIPSTTAFPATYISARCILTIVGIGVSRCSKRDFVANTVEHIIDHSDHAHEGQRAGLAKALGYVAQQHPDVAIDRLSGLAKVVEKKSFFGGGNKGKKGPLEISRSVAGQGLCYATRRMPAGILPSRLDAAVFPVLSSVLADFKHPEVRDEVLATIPLLENPIKKLGAYNFKTRDSFIELLLSLTGLIPVLPPGAPAPPSSKENSKIPPAVVLKLSTLVGKSIAAVTKASQSPAIADDILVKIVTHLVVPFGKKEWTDCSEEAQTAGEQAMSLVMGALINNTSVIPLNKLCDPLLQMSQSPLNSERSKAIQIIKSTVEAAMARVEKEAQQEGGATGNHGEQSTVGSLVARMIPRVLDVIPPIRVAALDAIERCIRLFSYFHPDAIEAAEVDVESTVAELAGLEDRAESLVRDGTQANEREAAAITKILCAHIVGVFLEEEHFLPILESLLTFGVLDQQEHAASCSCIVLHGMVRGLGGGLGEGSAKKFLTNIVATVPRVRTREQVFNGLLLSVRNLTKHHTLASFHQLLSLEEPPYSQQLVESIEAVGNDAGLAKTFILHCIDSLLNSQLVEERPDAKDKRKSVRDVTVVPLAAAAAIGAISQAAKGAEVAARMKVSVFGSLIIYMSAVQELGNPERIAVVVNSIQQVLRSVANEVTLERMERYGWQYLGNPTFFLVAACEILKYFNAEELEDTGANDREFECTPQTGLQIPPKEATDFVNEIATFILPYANKPTPSHRRVAINVSSFLLQNCLGDTELLQAVVTALLSRSGVDEYPLLRAEALNSMNQLSVHKYDDISPYVAPVLAALLSNFNEPDEMVVLAAMVTLCNVVTKLSDKRQVAPTVVNIILKVKILFECPNPEIRKMSFEVLWLLFDLANDGHLTASVVEQQIHLHLATMLVHIDDEVMDVRRVDKKALLSAMKFLETHAPDENAEEKIAEVFSKPHIQTANKTRLDEFFNDFCFLWVLHMPGHVNDLLQTAQVFFDSDREPLRHAAVILCGYMLRHLPPKELARASIDQLMQNLTRKLNPDREKSPLVRSKVARAISMVGEL